MRGARCGSRAAHFCIMIYPMSKSAQVSVWAGTRKGAFVFRSHNRKTWSVEGPFFRGMEVHHVAHDPREPGRYYAAVNSAWFGAHIHASEDGGRSWKLSEAGLAVKSVPGATLIRLWHIEPGAADEPGVVYAGGDPGVLFRSGDWGRTWDEVASLIAHATRPDGIQARAACACTRYSAWAAAGWWWPSPRRGRSAPATAAPHGSRSTRTCAPISSRISTPKWASACTSCWRIHAIPRRSINRTIAASTGRASTPAKWTDISRGLALAVRLRPGRAGRRAGDSVYRAYRRR